MYTALKRQTRLESLQTANLSQELTQFQKNTARQPVASPQKLFENCEENKGRTMQKKGKRMFTGLALDPMATRTDLNLTRILVKSQTMSSYGSLITSWIGKYWSIL